MIEARKKLFKFLIPLICVGGIGGLVGFFYLTALKLTSQWLGPAGHPQDHILQLIIMIAVGLIIPLLIYWFGSPGNVEILVNNINLHGTGQDISTLRSLVPISLLCIGSGGAAGPEAPLVQTTGAIGSWLAMRFGLPVERRRILTITGMASGFAVLFGAPLGAAVFSLEILHRNGLEYYEALIPSLIGALCGYVIYVISGRLGVQPVWHFPAIGVIHESDFMWAFFVGLVGGLLAMAFTYANTGVGKLFKKIPVWVRSAVGGILLVGLALWSPYALTFGEVQVSTVALMHATLGFFAVAFLAKFIGTTITLSSDWKGGFIIPIFFMGVALGRFAHVLIPSANEVVLMVAFMTALNTGVTKTPLGSTLVVTKMAGIQLLPTTILAALVALFVSGSVGMIETEFDRDSGLSTGEFENIN